MTLYIVILALQQDPSQSWTCPQSCLSGLECLEDIFNVDLLNIECCTIQVPDSLSGQLLLEKLDRRGNPEEKHEWYSVVP